jgi:hypothetical protein
MPTPVRVLWRASSAAGAIVAVSLVAACGSAQPNQPAAPLAPVASDSPSSVLPPSGSAPGAPTTGPSSVPAGPTQSAAPSAPSASASGGAGAGLATCRTASLRITVGDDQAGGSAGSAYYPLNFTNMSGTPCQMYGYPGVSFAAAPNGAGRQIGVAAARSYTFAKVAVRLGAGGTAHAWLRVTVAASYPASDCQPVTAHWLRVYPPEETVPGYVSHSFTACTSTATALLTVLPVRLGEGVAGVTP